MAHTRKSHRSPALSQFLCINTLRLFWTLVVIWGELGAFYWSLRNCRWPGITGAGSSISKDSLHGVSQETKDKSVSHVLLLSDTQVQHPALQTGHEPWTVGFRRFFSDLNLKKSWHVTAQLKPDVIIFLGDMLANGRGAKDETRYRKAVEKFKSIFSASVPVYYAPGNNDIWLGEITPYARAVRRFYTESFGPPSQTFDVQNHTFVILDAPGLVDEDYLRSGKGVPFSKWKSLSDGAISFVEEIASNREAEELASGEAYEKKPIILLSHIPLSRPELANCGPLRERGTIRRNVGHGYQSMLGRQTTTFLLQILKPLAVFSGDNRDYCEHQHTIAGDEHSIREVTLKSFSPSAHTRRPGFQLLSVTAPSTASRPSSQQPTIADAPCFLPDQKQIYTAIYAPSLCLTLFLLFVLNFRRRSRASPIRRRQQQQLRLTGKQRGFKPWGPLASPVTGSTIRRAGSLQSVTSLRQHGNKSASGRSTPSRQFSAPLSPLRLPNALPSSQNYHHHPSSEVVVPESPFGMSHYAAGSRSDLALDRQLSSVDAAIMMDEEDPMQPAQYATVDVRRDMAIGSRYDAHDHDQDEEDGWSDIGRSGLVGISGYGADDDDDDEDEYFARVEAGGLSTSRSSSAANLLSLSPPAVSDLGMSGSTQMSSLPAFQSPLRWKEFGGGGGEDRGGSATMLRRPLFSYSFVLGGRMRRITIRRPTLGALSDLVELLKGTSGGRRKRGNVFWATAADVFSVAWGPLCVWWMIIWFIS